MNEEMDKEINDMENLLTASSVAPGTELSGTTAPATTIVTMAPGTVAPGTTAPSTTAPATEAPVDESTKLREELELLKAENAKLKGPKTSTLKTTAPSTEAPLADQDFLNGADIDDITRDPAQFNKVLNAVLMKGIELGKAHTMKTSEGIIRSIPDITKRNVEMVINLKTLSEQFYKEHKDLEPFKKVVALVFEERIAANPDKTYEEVLKDVAPEARKRLDLHQKTVIQTKTDDQKPNLPRKKGQQRIVNQPNPNAIESELSDMNKALDS